MVSGASSGIGEAIPRQLAAKGIHLVLVARREHRQKKLADDLQNRHPVRTRIIPIDLAADDFLPVIAGATREFDIGFIFGKWSAGCSRTSHWLELHSRELRGLQDRAENWASQVALADVLAGLGGVGKK